ncbi:hypothetical protein ACA910_017270 [Epithemia clementina (nom. ined.)]
MSRFGPLTRLLIFLLPLGTTIAESSDSARITLSGSVQPAAQGSAPTAFATRRFVIDTITNKGLRVRGGASSGDNVDKSTNTGEGTMSMTASVFNLVNNVAGAGILALSAAQAAGTGWVPSIVICSALGAISGRTFVMVGESCDMLKERDFKGLWKRTVNEKSAFFVDAIVAMLCLSLGIIYSGILGDVSTFLLSQTRLPPHFNTRISNIVITTIFLLLPMGLIKDLSVLAFTSILGFSAVMYTVFLIVARALDGKYKPGSGLFVTDGALRVMPSFEKQSLWNVGFSSLVLTSTLGLAYISHYNAPIFYRQLEDATPHRFGKLVYSSFFFLTILYVATMAAGYSTFGDNCMGNILLNYHPKDVLATFGRVATWFSILFGFPLVSNGAREGLIGAATSLGFSEVGYDKYNFPLVVGILLFVTTIACVVKDVSFVVGLAGAMFGSFIVYICPTMCYVKAVEITKGKGSREYKNARLNYTLIPFGIFIGLLGVYMTIKEASSKTA